MTTFTDRHGREIKAGMRVRTGKGVVLAVEKREGRLWLEWPSGYADSEGEDIPNCLLLTPERASVVEVV